MTSRSGRQPGQRQLRVGELLRHALSDMIARGATGDPGLDGAAITVLEVSVSPDLKQATAYVMPLGGVRQAEIVEALQRSRKQIRGFLSRAVSLRHTPDLRFELDTSFDRSAGIDRLLGDPRVARDLTGRDRETG